jgi:hypothetical protein
MSQSQLTESFRTSQITNKEKQHRNALVKWPVIHAVRNSST